MFKIYSLFFPLECSGRIQVDAIFSMQLISPLNELNNGSITAFECRWLIQSKIPTNILGIKFHKLDFLSTFDMVTINDGLSEISPPLLQVTVCNRNNIQSKFL